MAVHSFLWFPFPVWSENIFRDHKYFPGAPYTYQLSFLKLNSTNLQFQYFWFWRDRK